MSNEKTVNDLMNIVYPEDKENKFSQQSISKVLIPIPQEALYLGTAESDGLPILFNMSLGEVGSILITAPKNHKVRNLFWSSISMTKYNFQTSIRKYYDVNFVVITEFEKDFYTS